jgi:hypothetical protein
MGKSAGNTNSKSSTRKRSTSSLDNKQSDAFIEAARELGCDDDPAQFDDVLKKVARHEAPAKLPKADGCPKTDKPIK